MMPETPLPSLRRFLADMIYDTWTNDPKHPDSWALERSMLVADTIIASGRLVDRAAMFSVRWCRYHNAEAMNALNTGEPKCWDAESQYRCVVVDAVIGEAATRRTPRIRATSMLNRGRHDG